MDVVRRLIAILLFAMFVLPSVLPLLAVGQDGEAGLPACCRREGKHHCMMGMRERRELAPDHGASYAPAFTLPADKCPYCPASVAPAQPNPSLLPSTAVAVFGDLVSHPTGFAQSEARGRISRDRSNQKRGPPTLTSL